MGFNPPSGSIFHALTVDSLPLFPNSDRRKDSRAGWELLLKRENPHRTWTFLGGGNGWELLILGGFPPKSPIEPDVFDGWERWECFFHKLRAKSIKEYEIYACLLRLYIFWVPIIPTPEKSLIEPDICAGTQSSHWIPTHSHLNDCLPIMRGRTLTFCGKRAGTQSSHLFPLAPSDEIENARTRQGRR